MACCEKCREIEALESIANGILDSNGILDELRSEVSELTTEVHAVAVAVSRIASILEAEHRPQAVRWRVGTPTLEG